MISFIRILLLTSLAYSVTAHFTLDYPTTRGFDEEKENVGPCGSFDVTKESLSPWYAANGPVQIDSHHDPATIQIFLSYNHNVTMENYNKLPMSDVMHLKGEGEFCFKINANSSKPTNATSAVIIVEHISQHGRLYQCSDVKLSEDASLGANISCNGSLVAAPSSSPSDESNAAAQSASLITSLLVAVTLAAAISCLLSR